MAHLDDVVPLALGPRFGLNAALSAFAVGLSFLPYMRLQDRVQNFQGKQSSRLSYFARLSPPVAIAPTLDNGGEVSGVVCSHDYLCSGPRIQLQNGRSVWHESPTGTNHGVRFLISFFTVCSLQFGSSRSR